MPGRTTTAPAVDVSLSGDAARPRVWRAAWRQHGSWVVVTLALAVVGALLLAAAAATVPACASTAWWETPGAACSVEPAETFWKLFRLGMLACPVLVGALLGAVTFGSDVEHRTQVFSLSQGVSRLRWWMAKVVVVSAPVFVAFALLGMATLWVVNTSDDSVISMSRLTSPGFDLLGLIPAARFLVAYAAAAAAALLWRTVGGLVTGLLVVGVVVVIGTLLQPLVVHHQRNLIPLSAFLTQSAGAVYVSTGEAYENDGFADAAGRDVDAEGFDCGNADFNSCAMKHATYRVETFVPDSQFPRMTVLISGVNLLLAGALLGAGARAIRRRDL